MPNDMRVSLSLIMINNARPSRSTLLTRFPLIRRLALLAAMVCVYGVAAPSLAAEDQRSILADDHLAITGGDLTPVLIDLTPDQLESVLDDPQQLRSVVFRAYRDLRMIEAAEQIGLDDTPAVMARLEAARRLVLTEALREHFVDTLDLPDFAELARERYATRPDDLVRPEAYRFAQIVRRVECDCERDAQQAEVEAILSSLNAGTDFAELARQYSQDASALDGGELPGWVAREKLAAPLAAALKRLEDGAVSEPIETRAGIHVLKRLAHRVAEMPAFEEVQSTLEASIEKNYVRDRIGEALGEYLPAPDTAINQAALEAFAESLRNGQQ